ncbi:PRC-barrel domain containing protein [Methanoplanus sp. FWC-SCC4]|uniref:PRC-barrel domain containing protein n=1 Tax=Methanochimaera problematica TaxID=2609417 RepID=A0AA97FCJ1_9EURY|nr:PRC-barrel domain-containing protein [Methanoplanus sp. FWC-SCC4]WOF16552.1 PRC-barrel domain containing protein [Methanoplanus sp. FWC-SCC4]
MKNTFSRSLSKKQVMSTDGMVIGTIRNIMVDMDSGQVESLVVRPETGFDTAGYTIDGDRLFIPFEAVRDIRDYIVVDRYLSKQ